MEMTMTETLRVMPTIGRLNKYLQRAKRVAIRSINPVYLEQDPDGSRRLEGFNICVEGPAKYVSYFRQMIDDANLKIS